MTAQGQGDLQGRGLSLYAAKRRAEGTRVLGALGNSRLRIILFFYCSVFVSWKTAGVLADLLGMISGMKAKSLCT